MGRPFLASLLAGDPATRRLLPRDFRDAGARAARVNEVKSQAVSSALLGELRRQDAWWPTSAARQRHLAALARPGTVAVITGQQVGLFLGPLYTFYKAATAVAVARALERESGVPAVPVFWLQTEDHDFPEIADCHALAARSQPCRVTVAPDPSLSPRSSVAHVCLGDDVEVALAALSDALGMGPGADDVMRSLRAHYRPGVPIGRAFGGLIAELFADDGLIVFDPRTPAVAALAAPIYRKAIERQPAISQALLARKAELEAAGLDEQVPTRADCALVFFHEGSASGPRHRLERREGGGSDNAWQLAGSPTRVSDAELADCLTNDPLRFSTSALLRPIVQDTLFPTAAYVGGPAELGYFAQLPPLYDLFGLPQPLPVLRARFRCVDPKSAQLLATLGLEARDLERPDTEIEARLAALAARQGDLPAPATLTAEMQAALHPALDRLTAVLNAADTTLAKPAGRTSAGIRHSVERLIEKYARALGRRDTTTLDRVERLRAHLCPGRTPQERHYGWPWIAAAVGPAAFARAVADRIVPFATAIEDITP